jgi:pyruvate/oxaloacetate carboxyltransferase
MGPGHDPDNMHEYRCNRDCTEPLVPALSHSDTVGSADIETWESGRFAACLPFAARSALTRLVFGEG